MTTLFYNIKGLLQIRNQGIQYVSGSEMTLLPALQDAYLLVENGLIKDFGVMENCLIKDVDTKIDATGKYILPTWCDSHTHIVYAGNRESEFVDRIHGLSYEEIANKGGGILNSALQLGSTSEDNLYEQSISRVHDVISLGSGALEIKSGYGLSKDNELKMLRVIKRIKNNVPIEIKATFLGAHAIPKEYKNNRSGYIKMMVKEILPIIQKEDLAQYIDVFCEQGYFTPEETSFIINSGREYGLQSKIHVNQFHSIGGVQVGVKHGALSVDHLEVMTKEDIDILKDSNTMPVGLPGCSLFLGIPYAPLRKMIDHGLPVALASDYNPGSAPSGNMNLVLSLACIKMRLSPEEAINACTLNAAFAMGLERQLGSITIGKKANLILTKKINSYAALPYSFGSNLIDQVFINGIPYTS